MDKTMSFRCAVCKDNYEYKSSKIFLTHLNNHSNTEKNKFLCLQVGCFKELQDLRNFKKHIQNHEQKTNSAQLNESFTTGKIFNDSEEGISIHDYIELDTSLQEESSFISEEENGQFDSNTEFCFNENAENYIFKVAASLYGSTTFTIKDAVEILKLLKDFSNITTKFCIERISCCKTVDEAVQVLSFNSIFDFEDISTEEKFKKKLIEKDLFREPQRFTMGNEALQRHQGKFECLPHQGIIFEISFQIRKFLELENMLESIIEHQESMKQLGPGMYANFVNGSFWQGVQERYCSRVNIPIFLYNDDFQVDRFHQATHSLSPFYYLFPTLPPHIYSKLRFIFTALIAKSSDVKMFGNDSMLYALVNVFYKLETDGIELFKGTPSQRKIHIITSKIIGDNLSLHASCGFRQAFTIRRPCITCEITLDDLRNTVDLNPELKRTVQKYDNYFIENTYFEFGVEKPCIFNNLPSFHVSNNDIVDITHDINLGVIPFVMKFALNYFISTYPDFTLKALNERIQSFDYGRKEKGNKPSRILDSHLKNGLQMNANETLFFLRYFPLLSMNMVPPSDPVLQFIINTIEIVDLLYKSALTDEEINILEDMIKENRRKYSEEFGQKLRPKDHNMLHYVSAIRANGPLKYISTIRPEGKHRLSRLYTNNTTNRINLPYSVAKKEAYSFASFILNSKNITQKISSFNKISVPIPNDIQEYLINTGYDPAQFCQGNYFFLKQTLQNINRF